MGLKQHKWICIVVLTILAIIALTLTMITIQKRNQKRIDLQSTTTLTPWSSAITTDEPPITTNTNHYPQFPYGYFLLHPLPKEVFDMEVSEDDVQALAHVLTAETSGIDSCTERAALLWVILNRAEKHGATAAAEVAKIYYTPWTAEPTDTDIEIARGILQMREYEKKWMASTEEPPITYMWEYGRIIPRDFLYYYREDDHIYYYTEQIMEVDLTKCWQFEWPTPYTN